MKIVYSIVYSGMDHEDSERLEMYLLLPNKTYPFPKSNHLGRKTHLSTLKTLGVHHIIQAPLETALWSCSHTFVHFMYINLDKKSFINCISIYLNPSSFLRAFLQEQRQLTAFNLS